MGSVAAETIAELLSRGLSVRFVAEGDSMYPLIRSGDALLVQAVTAGDVRLGEVVLSRTARGLTAHRIVGISAEGGAVRIVTRGDNLRQSDDPFGEDGLLGRIVEVDRSGSKHAVARASGAVLEILRLVSRLRTAAARRLKL